jgi:hypothetical protein
MHLSSLTRRFARTSLTAQATLKTHHVSLAIGATDAMDARTVAVTSTNCCARAVVAPFVEANDGHEGRTT